MRVYLNVEEVILIHENLIKEFGGSFGLRDKKGLDSAVMRPQTGYYNDIYEEAAALMESLAMNHPFIDGNKRISFFATDVFLRLNGYFIECDNREAYDFFMNLFVSKKFTFAHLLPWLKDKIKSLE